MAMSIPEQPTDMWAYKKGGGVYHRLRVGSNVSSIAMCGWYVHWIRRPKHLGNIYHAPTGHMDWNADGEHWEPCKRCEKALVKQGH